MALDNLSKLKHLTQIEITFLKLDFDNIRLCLEPFFSIKRLALNGICLAESQFSGVQFCRFFSRFFPNIEELYVSIDSHSAVENLIRSIIIDEIVCNLAMFGKLRKQKIRKGW